MNAKYDDLTIKLTPRFERAIVELLKAQCEMMQKRMPETADCWTWGQCKVADLSLTSGLKFMFGGDKDMNQERPRFDIITDAP